MSSRQPKTPIFWTPPLAIVDRPARSTHYTKGRGGFDILMILIHHSGGTINSDLPWLTWQCPPGRRVSTHRYISKPGVNYKVVKDEDTAFTAGFGLFGPIDPDPNDPPGIANNFNQVSLHIEPENLGDGRDPYPTAQRDMIVAQCVEWHGLYGYIGIYGHMDLDTRKADPAGWDWPDFWTRMEKRYRFVMNLREV